jgi:hypothetical protein
VLTFLTFLDLDLSRCLSSASSSFFTIIRIRVLGCRRYTCFVPLHDVRDDFFPRPDSLGESIGLVTWRSNPSLGYRACALFYISADQTPNSLFVKPPLEYSLTLPRQQSPSTCAFPERTDTLLLSLLSLYNIRPHFQISPFARLFPFPRSRIHLPPTNLEHSTSTHCHHDRTHTLPHSQRESSPRAGHAGYHSASARSCSSGIHVLHSAEPRCAYEYLRLSV